MRSLIAAIVLLPALAIAQPGAEPVRPVNPMTASTSAEILGLARGAHVAGARGDCVGARVLAGRIQRIDPDFYAAVISTDLSITACKPKPRVYAVDPELPAVLKPVARRPVLPNYPIDAGAKLPNQLFLGSVMGAGLGFLGVVAGIGGDDEGLGVLAYGSLGLVVGTTAGVVFAGDNAGSDYSLGLTLAGSITGTLLGWKIVLGGSDIDSPALAIGILVGMPTLGAMLGFNASRRTLYAPTTQAAIPAAPRIGDPTTSMPLLGGSF